MKFGFDQCFSMDCIGHSGGLAIFWKRHVNCQVDGYSRNHIDVVFAEANNAGWRLTYYYGFPERARRNLLWDFLIQLSNLSQLPWYVWGDFNDLLYAADKIGNTSFPLSLMEGVRIAINECRLSEIDLHGERFTWE